MVKYGLYIKEKITNNKIDKRQGGKKMKLVKGMIIGGMVSAGLIMMYGETMGFNKKKMMKQGKKMMHKMGW